MQKSDKEQFYKELKIFLIATLVFPPIAICILLLVLFKISGV